MEGLDIAVADALGRRKRGFFVEAGANDGLAQSNTYLLERTLGWRGLLIEPLPDLADQCRQARPHCIVEQAALVSRDFEGDFVEMRHCNLMSVVRGGMKSREEEDAHVAAGAAIQRVEPRVVEVPVATLSALLDKHRIEHVDLLSLDVEGYEANALAGLDLMRHRPEFMLIEARYRHDVEAVIGREYEPVYDLTHHDVLYRIRS